MSISTDTKILTILIFFIMLFFTFNIGYASEFENQGNGFSIEFENVEIISYDGIDIKETKALISPNHNDIFLNISDLQYPGAFVEYSIEVINNGNKNAKIENIIVNGFENSNVIKYRIVNKNELDNVILRQGESIKIDLIIEWDKKAYISEEEFLNFNIQIPICSEIE